MSITCHNLCDDWGWYVDIETTNPICQDQVDKAKVTNKKNTTKFIKLETFEEDEYDYYTFNQKNSCEFDIENNNKISQSICKKKDNNNVLIINILNISSTTMITALLTYVIFFML